jgi:SPP1 family predicted phage head-tail adaptor
VPLAAGRLNRRVILERRTEETDSSGQSRVTFTPVAEVGAQVEPVGGARQFGEQQFVSTGDLRITVRWRPDLNPLHRVTYRGEPYDIVSIVEAGNLEALVILVRGRAERRGAELLP